MAAIAFYDDESDVNGVSSESSTFRIDRKKHQSKRDKKGSKEDGTAWAHIVSWEVFNDGLADAIKGKGWSDEEENQIAMWLQKQITGVVVRRIKRHNARTKNKNAFANVGSKNSDHNLDVEIIRAMNHNTPTRLSEHAYNRAKRQWRRFQISGGEIPDKLLMAARSCYTNLLREDGHKLVRANATFNDPDGNKYKIETLSSSSSTSSSRKNAPSPSSASAKSCHQCRGGPRAVLAANASRAMKVDTARSISTCYLMHPPPRHHHCLRRRHHLRRRRRHEKCSLAEQCKRKILSSVSWQDQEQYSLHICLKVDTAQHLDLLLDASSSGASSSSSSRKSSSSSTSRKNAPSPSSAGAKSCQCRGTTQSGTRCKRTTRAEADFVICMDDIYVKYLINQNGRL